MKSLSGNVNHSPIVVIKRSKINPSISFEQFKHGVRVAKGTTFQKKRKKKALQIEWGKKKITVTFKISLFIYA